MSELQEILIQKSDQLDLADINLLLESLSQRKTQLETVIIFESFDFKF